MIFHIMPLVRYLIVTPLTLMRRRLRPTLLPLKEQFPAVRELTTQTRARREAIGLSSLWDLDPTTGLVRTQSGG